MTEVKVITKNNDYWIKIPKSVVQNKELDFQNGKISAFVSGSHIELVSSRDRKSEKYTGYKEIIEANSDVLKRLADA